MIDNQLGRQPRHGLRSELVPPASDATPDEDPAAVLGAPGSVLPEASSEPCETPPAFQASTANVSDRPASDADQAARPLEETALDRPLAAGDHATAPDDQAPDEILTQPLAEPSVHTSAEPERAPTASAYDWARALAVCRLRFVDDCSAAAVRKRLGIDRAYYRQCMRWLLGEVVPTLNRGPRGPDCDRRAIADAAAGLATMPATLAVNDHAKQCPACATYTRDLFAAAATFVTTEKPDGESASASGVPIIRQSVSLAELNGLRRDRDAGRRVGRDLDRTSDAVRPTRQQSPARPAPAAAPKPSRRQAALTALGLVATGVAGAAGVAHMAQDSGANSLPVGQVDQQSTPAPADATATSDLGLPLSGTESASGARKDPPSAAPREPAKASGDATSSTDVVARPERGARARQGADTRPRDAALPAAGHAEATVDLAANAASVPAVTAERSTGRPVGASTRRVAAASAPSATESVATSRSRTRAPEPAPAPEPVTRVEAAAPAATPAPDAHAATVEALGASMRDQLASGIEQAARQIAAQATTDGATAPSVDLSTDAAMAATAQAAVASAREQIASAFDQAGLPMSSADVSAGL